MSVYLQWRKKMLMALKIKCVILSAKVKWNFNESLAKVGLYSGSGRKWWPCLHTDVWSPPTMRHSSTHFTFLPFTTPISTPCSGSSSQPDYWSISHVILELKPQFSLLPNPWLVFFPFPWPQLYALSSQISYSARHPTWPLPFHSLSIMMASPYPSSISWKFILWLLFYWSHLSHSSVHFNTSVRHLDSWLIFSSKYIY